MVGSSTPRCGCARELAPTNPSARHTPATFPQIFILLLLTPWPEKRRDRAGTGSGVFFSRGLSAASSSIMESDRRRRAAGAPGAHRGGVSRGLPRDGRGFYGPTAARATGNLVLNYLVPWMGRFMWELCGPQRAARVGDVGRRSCGFYLGIAWAAEFTGSGGVCGCGCRLRPGISYPGPTDAWDASSEFGSWIWIFPVEYLSAGRQFGPCRK
jgi:hypothetical protein